MIPEKMLEVLKYEGLVAIVTQGDKGAHVVNTWNSYLKITEDERILGPVGARSSCQIIDYNYLNGHINEYNCQ